jgi:hypothetical protein
MHTCPKCGVVLTHSEATGDFCPSCHKRAISRLRRMTSGPRFLGMLMMVTGALLFLLFVGFPLLIVFAGAGSAQTSAMGISLGIILLCSGAGAVVFGERAHRWHDRIESSWRVKLVTCAILLPLVFLFWFAMSKVVEWLGFVLTFDSRSLQ